MHQTVLAVALTYGAICAVSMSLVLITAYFCQGMRIRIPAEDDGESKKRRGIEIPMDEIKEVEIQTDDEVCTICMDPFLRGDCGRQLSCEHVFHSECLTTWWVRCVKKQGLRPSATRCPLCRSEQHIWGETNEAINEECQEGRHLTVSPVWSVSYQLPSVTTSDSLWLHVGLLIRPSIWNC